MKKIVTVLDKEIEIDVLSDEFLASKCYSEVCCKDCGDIAFTEGRIISGSELLPESGSIILGRDKVEEILNFCRPHLEYKWSATIVSMLLGGDFRDSKETLESYFKEVNNGKK